MRPWKANPLVMLPADVDEDVRQQSVVTGGLDNVKGLSDSVARATLGLRWPIGDGLLFTTGTRRGEVVSKRNTTDITEQSG